jgi:hypothetical protein
LRRFRFERPSSRPGIVTVSAGSERVSPDATTTPTGITATSGTSDESGGAAGSERASASRSRRASAADSGRSSRCFSVIEATQPSSDAGTAGFADDGLGIGSWMCR